MFFPLLVIDKYQVNSFAQGNLRTSAPGCDDALVSYYRCPTDGRNNQVTRRGVAAGSYHIAAAVTKHCRLKCRTNTDIAAAKAGRRKAEVGGVAMYVNVLHVASRRPDPEK
jgi:hypothetical protein